MAGTYLRRPGLGEIARLYRLHYADPAAAIAVSLRHAEEMGARIAERLGRPLEGLDVLEIGPGQRGVERLWYARANRYVGIDIEVGDGASLVGGFLRDLRRSGTTRALKTLGRRALGLDRAYTRELRRQLGYDGPAPRVVEMDAASMTFPDDCFDVVYSVSVFEHLPDVEAVTREVARVLRPGGVAAILTHIWTSDTGIHDPRLFGARADLPFWAHLRAETSGLVAANCYLNKLRLDDYRAIFHSGFGAPDFLLFQAGPEARTALSELRAAGALADYTDEELLTDVLCTLWQKPAAVPPLV